MARITVEDCLKNVKNRFDLVAKASKRARELAFGATATLPWENDKTTVMALREIAANTLSPDTFDEFKDALDAHQQNISKVTGYKASPKPYATLAPFQSSHDDNEADEF